MYNFQIWQLKDVPENRDIRFEPYKVLKGHHPEKGRYECVYEEKEVGNTPFPQLEAIFTDFQHDSNPPAEFKGHSLSVSDVVVISLYKGTYVAFYCDSFGFRLTSWEDEKPKKYTTETLVQEAYTAAVAQGYMDEWLKIEDYFSGSYNPVPVNDMEFDPICYPGYGGSEGIYVDCHLKGRIDSSKESKMVHIGTFKTLNTDLDAMITAGKVAGIMTAMICDIVNANWDSFCPEKE